MKIQEIIEIARYSELGGVAVKDNDTAIVAFMNMGMLELYTRFPIKTQEHVVALVDGTINYALPSDYMYALTAYREPQEGEGDDLIKMPINEEDVEVGVVIPDWRTLQVPSEVEGNFVSVVYVSKPDTIDVNNLSVEIELPDTLIDALLSYVGYRAHLGVRGDAQSENNAHWQRFELSCKKAEELGVAFPADSWKMDSRIKDRGFA